jgi:prolipoprotein diacylglyceryltransferase
MAYYLDNFSPFIVKFGSNLGIRWYGLSYLLAFFCAVFCFSAGSRNAAFAPCLPRKSEITFSWHR